MNGCHGFLEAIVGVGLALVETRVRNDGPGDLQGFASDFDVGFVDRVPLVRVSWIDSIEFKPFDPLKAVTACGGYIFSGFKLKLTFEHFDA